jgi:hypothetical protein
MTTAKQNGKKGGKFPHMPKPEDPRGKSPLRQCPLVKYHADRNPKYHEEHHKDVATKILAAYPHRILVNSYA